MCEYHFDDIFITHATSIVVVAETLFDPELTDPS